MDNQHDRGEPPTNLASDSWTLITVTFNSANHLRANWANRIDGARWIVVDNNSTDGSAELAQSLGAHVIPLEQNVGFSAANNVALKSVDTDFCLFVNPDVHVGDRNDLVRLAAVSSYNGQALVAPQLLNPDGTDQQNARGLPYLIDKVANRSVRLPGSKLHEYARAGFAGPTKVAWVMGAAVGGPTRRFVELSGWDERYFIYYEDHDLGLRAWLNGVPVLIDPRVRWRHEWQRATTKVRWSPWRHELRSMRLFYRTYPELLMRPRLRTPPQRHAALRTALWRSAVDPPTVNPESR